MHPSLAHPIDRSILAPPIAPHTLESREGDDSCKTRVSLVLQRQIEPISSAQVILCQQVKFA